MNDRGADALSTYPFGSRRSVVLAARGAVATSQPLAAAAGLRALEAGGSAVDAAVAAAATLVVVEPTSNGLGGDAFAIVWDGEQLHGLNGSGRSPAGLDAARIISSGRPVARRGWDSVTVPGAVDAWQMLHDRFGMLPIETLLADAIHHAEQGFPVTPVVARLWAEAVPTFTGSDDPALADWAPIFAPSGRAPRAGELWGSEAIATGLNSLLERGLRDFYEGDTAAALVDHSDATGGCLSRSDLADHHGEWVDPISVSYLGHEVWELPPNGQGVAALIALGIARNTRASELEAMDARAWHLGIEAIKLAFADSDRHVADPDHAPAPIAQLLDERRLEALAETIGDRAGPPAVGLPVGGTVYLAAADRDGMMVSFIQSNYGGFGSGVVVPSNGVSLQNRGAGFDVDPASPNVVAPSKRPRHTIIPGFLTRDGRALGPFGVMGGEMQPQGHLQVVQSLLDRRLNPQAALDAPRWRVDRSGTVHLEPGAPAGLVERLSEMGHPVVVDDDDLSFGRGQVILRDEHGTFAAGSEPRADGCAVGY